ncbi:MAG TPA: zinc ABC transporter substrate-binding protein [Gemmatales bacterium]|nr:zinc ABC transporter substrate-binding protein [Gemmatales bacterium]
MSRLIVGMVLLSLVGCSPLPRKVQGSVSSYKGSYPINVVCTTGMVGDLVRNIGGSHVRVTQLMNAGVDPHLYKTSPGDIKSLNEADLICYSGQHLEGKMADLLHQLSRTRRSVAVTDSIAADKLLKNEDGIVDPHLWFDVSIWQQAAHRVLAELCDYDPSHAEAYKKAAGAYDAELEKLHQYARTQLTTIDNARRVLVTAHDAFHYFGRAYQLEVKSIQGISTESEASVKQVNDLVAFMVDRKIKAVFVESSVSEKNIKALVEGCASRGHVVAIGGELYSDAPGADGTPDGTYVGMVKHNVDTIVKALK